MIACDTSPPEGFPPVGTSSETSFNDIVTQKAIAYRESLGNQLLPTFITRTKQLTHLLAQLSPQDWEKPAYRFSRIVPLRNYLYLSVQELVLHSWDIHSQLDPSIPLSVESLPALQQRIPQRFSIPWVADFARGTRLPSPLYYRWEVIGASATAYDIVVEEGICRIEPAGAAIANVRFCSDAETFVLLMYGRLTLDPAIAAGRLTVEGNQKLTAAFDRWLKGT